MRSFLLGFLLLSACRPVIEVMTPDGPVTVPSRCVGCTFGFTCNEDTGLCERLPCGGRCSADEVCENSPAGPVCVAQKRPPVPVMRKP